MTVLKRAATLLICLGLGIPSAHGIAVCVDGDGNVAVEAAVNGACAGTQVPSCGEGSGAGTEFSLQGRDDDHCGSCRDVVLSGSDMRPPVEKDSKARRLERPDGSTASLPEDMSSVDDTSGRTSRFAAASTAADRSPPNLTVVLRL